MQASSVGLASFMTEAACDKTVGRTRTKHWGPKPDTGGIKKSMSFVGQLSRQVSLETVESTVSESLEWMNAICRRKERRVEPA